MEHFVGLGAVILAESWYRFLQWVPPFLGIPLAVYLQHHSGHVALAMTAFAMISILWLRVDDMICLRFTPNVRNVSQIFFLKWMKDKTNLNKKIRVLDGFQQQVSRFLFEPNEEFWTNRAKDYQIEVRTTLPDGSAETNSWLRRGKGVCGFTRAGDLDAAAPLEAPYSFKRADHSRAVVRVWSKTVDSSFKEAFEMKQIWPIEVDTDKVTALTNLLSADEQAAFADFKQALTNLLPAEGLKGTIWKCTEKTPTMNKHLAIEGKLCDVIQFLREHSLAARHYFRCSVSESAILANMGFNKKTLPISPGKPETPIVLYIRQGTKHHVCAQTLEVFANDTRVPDRPSNQIVCSFGICELLEQLGAGTMGEVYKVRKDGQEFALKLAKQRNNQNDEHDVNTMVKEKIFADLLEHRFFMKIYDWGVEWPEGRSFPGVPKKGILMELGDESLSKFILDHSAGDPGRMLDPDWLKQCRDFMAQMAFAITYMHGKEVVHRDLKPENIVLKFVPRNGQTRKEVMLIDFGSAVQFHDRLGQDGEIPRITRAYSSPQVRRGDAYGMKCDVYSVGMTYDAMLRRRCFQHPSDESRYILYPDIECQSAPQGSPQEVKNLLSLMLKFEERDRYSASEILNRDPFFQAFTWRECQFAPISWATYV